MFKEVNYGDTNQTNVSNIIKFRGNLIGKRQCPNKYYFALKVKIECISLPFDRFSLLTECIIYILKEVTKVKSVQ